MRSLENQSNIFNEARKNIENNDVLLHQNNNFELEAQSHLDNIISSAANIKQINKGKIINKLKNF